MGLKMAKSWFLLKLQNLELLNCKSLGLGLSVACILKPSGPKADAMNKSLEEVKTLGLLHPGLGKSPWTRERGELERRQGAQMLMGQGRVLCCLTLADEDINPHLQIHQDLGDFIRQPLGKPRTSTAQNLHPLPREARLQDRRVGC
jgi:hypothetical protein